MFSKVDSKYSGVNRLVYNLVLVSSLKTQLTPEFLHHLWVWSMLATFGAYIRP